MEFVLNRNHVLVSKMGHSVAFRKGEPTFVPPAIVHEALAIGATAVGDTPDVLPEDQVDKTPVDPAERVKAIDEAILAIVATNDRMDFTAAGTPTAKAIERITGFDVDRREINAQWQAYHDRKAAEADAQ
jgi:hypothetical protein